MRPAREVRSTLWAERGDGHDRDTVGSPITVAATRDDEKRARFAVTVVIDLSRHREQSSRGLVDTALTEFHLDRSPAAVWQLNDCIDLAVELGVTPRRQPRPQLLAVHPKVANNERLEVETGGLEVSSEISHTDPERSDT